MSVLKIKDQNNNWTQIPTIKGEKGDPFTYADFTTEQLEFLKGKDGISPTVSVASDTSDDYRLSFTDETHTVTTPNLIPEAEKILSVYPHDTASGAVASFPDGADGIPLKSCIVQVEPVQDLHGYDHPWPAGGGKNKLNSTLATVALNGVTFTANGDGTYNTSGTASSNISNIEFASTVDLLPNTNYILSGCPSGGSTNTYRMNLLINGTDAVFDYGSGASFTTPTTITSAKVYPIVLSGTDMSGKVFKPMIRLASESDATFAPYENICPISGWTGMNINNFGKNCISNGAERQSITTSMYAKYTPVVSLEDATSATFSVSADVPSGQTLKLYCWTGKNNSSVGTLELMPDGRYALTNADIIKLAKEFRIYSQPYTGGSSVVTIVWDCTCVINETPTDYAPYTGQTYPITFPTEAGTVYGGYIDPINGELVVTHAEVDMGTLAWTKSSGRGVYFWVNLPLRKIGSALTSSLYPYYGTRPATYASASVGLYQETLTSDKFVDIYDPSYSDVAEIVSVLNGQQLVYELAEPIHYPLTPIEIKTILGQNNLWANTGDTEVEYRADVTMYINKKITEAVSALT